MARQDEWVRVGTWNLEGRWSVDHVGLLLAQDCDVWLLTEVRTQARLPGFGSQLTTARMGDHKHWAGVFSRVPLQSLPDPHPASAAALGAGWVWCSSVLPWRSCGNTIWGPGSTSQKTTRALNQLMASLPGGLLVWGGDWNHALAGREHVGGLAGRSAIEEALTRRCLELTTRQAPHRISGLHSIDHIAVPETVRVLATNRIVAETDRAGRLCDHDAYTTEIELA